MFLSLILHLYLDKEHSFMSLKMIIIITRLFYEIVSNCKLMTLFGL